MLALSAGSLDVAVALLTKPRGFETFTVLPTAMLATAGVILIAYLILWLAARPVFTRTKADPRSLAFAVAAWIGSAFTLAVLVGLHTGGVSPQALFRAAMIGVISTLVAAGVYALDVLLGEKTMFRVAIDALPVALPILLFEILVLEWVEVYLIDHPVSLLSSLIIAAFLVTATATIAAARYAGRSRSAAQLLTVFALLLAAIPATASVIAGKPGGVQASEVTSDRVPRRIILLTVDTLRADALSTYRPTAPRTNAVDEFARDSVVFEHALAPAPWTLPSLASILTGLLPAAHQTTGFTSSLSRNVTTLAEYLSEHGYYTGAIVHNDLLNPKNGLSQGFADYRTLDEQYFANSIGMTTLQHVAPSWFPPPSWPTNDDETGLAERWLDANRDRNFFLWMHYLDPHAPYAPPPAYQIAEPLPAIGRSFEGQKFATQGLFVPSLKERGAVRALYDGEVRYIDASIARLVATLKRLRLYDDALIVVTSDHGEEFWEHGRVGHGHSLYNELLQVPLIVKLPGSTRRGRATETVSTASIAPTILDLSRIRYDAGNVSVPSLAALLDPAVGSFAAAPIPSGAQIEFDHREAVTFDGFKYIVSKIDGKEELFDLKADPLEQHSVALSMTAQVEQGRQLLQAETAAAARLRKRIRVEEGEIAADEDTLRRLRSLGYLR